jgi:hypothetical protein
MIDTNSEAFRAAWIAYNNWEDRVPKIPPSFKPHPQDVGTKALARAITAYEAANPSEDYLINVLADIFMVTGLRERPMLSELAGEIGKLIKALRDENDKLRYALSKGQDDCIYCGLAKGDMGKCKSGFPGCARADDFLLGEAKNPPV